MNRDLQLKRKNKSATEEKPITTKKFKDIRDVVDKTRPFSIFYSGVENEAYFKGCYDMGVRNFLMSYQYVRGRNITSQYKDKGISLFIDSGAYTYMSDPKYLEYTEEQWEKQIKEYLNWARKHTESIFAMANLDLDFLVGSDRVLEWNKKYFEPFMVETGIPVCFVYHEENNTTMTWEEHCKRYPYVGISYATSDFDLNSGKLLLKIAEKYDTLVHGMGMTKTSILPQLPFYTVDSTSWKSGFRYGQLAIWNGKKVQMFGKEDWETKALKYTRNYDIDPPLDEEKMYDFYEPEILRANVYAYQKAEEFICESLKSRTYWFKKKSINRTEDDLADIEYPSVEWLDNANNQDDWEKYALSFNITTESKELALNNIIDLTCFMNWDNEVYSDFINEVYTPQVINELHDTWINRIVGSDEEKIEDLKHFFTQVLLGKEDKILHLGTNFDRTVKERDSYITDEEYETVDVSEMDIQNKLAKYLPPPKEGSPAPEISDLDDEIFREEGIEPVRDEKGRFIKGQKQVLKPKKMYSNKYPKMSCDMCFNAQKCPEYKAGYVCAYNKMFERYNTRDMADIIQAMQGIVDFSLMRLQRGMLTEVMNGGLPDASVTGMMNQSMGYLAQLQRMYECGSQEVIRQTKVLRSDGTQEMTTQVSNPQSGGILEKIFGDMGSSSDDDKETK